MTLSNKETDANLLQAPVLRWLFTACNFMSGRPLVILALLALLTLCAGAKTTSQQSKRSASKGYVLPHAHAALFSVGPAVNGLTLPWPRRAPFVLWLQCQWPTQLLRVSIRP
jgi:hypothetical protein